MTTRQVAVALGVPASYVNAMENRVRPVNGEYLLRFSRLYGKSPEWLVWGDAPPD